jgi:TonB-linked SusC/RagA family outer membrane protein
MKKLENHWFCEIFNRKLVIIELVFVVLLFTVCNVNAAVDSQTKSKNQTTNSVLQERNVIGTVTDSQGEVIPGVTVLIKGTTIGTVTDFDGNYNLANVPSEATLVFSFVGMLTQEIVIGSQTSINITMQVDAIGIEEVVAIGYGTQQKSKITGSVSSIKSDILIDRPIVSISQGLAGIDPGVNVIAPINGGTPGEQATISIRGEYANPSRSEFTQPLVLVDGFEADMNDLDPNQIAEMTILKDASATSIYGIRAAEGVILITTKGGKRNTPLRFNYKFQGGVQNATDIPQTLNTVDYMEFRNKAAINEEIYRVNKNNPDYVPSNLFPQFSQDVINRARNGEFPDTNWQDIIYGNTAPQFSHSLDAYGGTEKTNFMISLGMLDQDGMLVANDNYKRYNLRIKVDTDVTNWLTMGANVAYTNTEQNRADRSTTQDDARPAPNYPITDEYFGGSGLYVAGENGVSGNAVMASKNGSNDRTRRDVIEMSLYGKVKIVKGLTFDQKVNFRLVNTQVSDWSDNVKHAIYNFDGQTGEYSNAQGEGNTFGPFSANRSLFNSHNRSLHITSQSMLNYEYSIKDKHNFGALLGWQAEEISNEGFDAYRKGFATGALQRLEVGDVNDFLTNGSSANFMSYLSLFGRLNYDYKGKYLVEFTFRKDGSAEFAPGNQWGFFPAVSAGWNVAKESFMDDLKFVDMLKLRGSVGETGTDHLPGVSALPYYNRVIRTTGYSWPNGGLDPGFYLSEIASPDLIWETVKKLDVGIDLVLWGGKLSAVADYYQNTRTDQLVALVMPRSSGFAKSPANKYESESKGWEIKVTHRNKIGEVAYNISLNAANARSVWSSRPGDISWNNNELGWPLRQQFGYTMDGWISDNDELQEYINATSFGNGTQRYLWIGVPKLNDIGMRNTETKLREGTPDQRIDNWDKIQRGNDRKGVYKFGGNLGVSYRGASLTAVIDGTFNVDLVANLGIAFANGVGNTFTAMKELSFDPDNPSDDALFSIPFAGKWQYHTMPMMKSSFIRVRNINLSYNVRQRLIPALRNVKVYVTVENPLLLWTNSPLSEYGFDPEQGMVNSKYPLARTTTLGINIGL